MARQSGLEQAKQVVILGDGAHWIWKQAEEHFPDAVQIVDLSHAQEHVWQVARAVYGPQTDATEVWANNACDLLVNGNIEELVAAIADLPPIDPNPGESRSVPEKAIDYFLSNAERMRYTTFRAQGMHVGSGIAEAACKTVVATRRHRALACAGLLVVWMLFCLCALPFSTAPTTTSGRANLVWLLSHPQLIHTHT